MVILMQSLGETTYNILGLNNFFLSQGVVMVFPQANAHPNDSGDDSTTVWNSISIWLVLNAAFTGLGVMIARWHPVSIIVGALASPITSLNLSLAAGWFAGYTQLKMGPPTGKDALIS